VIVFRCAQDGVALSDGPAIAATTKGRQITFIFSPNAAGLKGKIAQNAHKLWP
jgi:hypothetical protein